MGFNSQLTKNFDVQFSYTYLDTSAVLLLRDFVVNSIIVAGRSSEIRRPRHSASLQLNYAFADDRAQMNVTAIHSAERDDQYFPPPLFVPTRVELDRYNRVDLAFQYAATDRMTVFGRVDNLFNQRYSELFSYNSPRRALVVGARINFQSN